MDKTALRIINVFDTIDELVFSLVMLTLPFGWLVSVIPLILLGALLLSKVIIKREKPNREKMLYFLPIFAFFVMLLVSLIYSSDVSRGFDLIGRKISLLIIPLLLLFTNFSPRIAQKGFRFFLLGTLIAALMYLVVGLFNSTHLSESMLCIIPGFEGLSTGILDTDIRNNYLMGEHFTFLMHPSYFGILLALSLVGVVFTHINQHKSILVSKISGPLFIVCSIALLLLSTNGALMTAITVAAFLIILAVRYKLSLDLKTYWIIFIAILLLFGTVSHPQFKVLTQQNKSAESYVMRQKVNETTLSLIKEHPFLGVGNGDLSSELEKKYKELGYPEMARMGIDPHNQYLVVFAETGILGLLILLWMLGTLLWYGFKKRNFLVVFFALIFGVNMLFESMLNRYWGILFFAVFYSLFYFYSIQLEEDTE